MVFLAKLALMFIINPIAAAGYLRFSEISLAGAFGIILLGTYLNMLVIYFGLGGVVSVFIKKVFVKTLLFMRLLPISVRGDSEYRIFFRRSKFLGRLRTKKNSFVNWLARRHLIIICMTFVLGPLPYLPSLLVVAFRMKNMGGIQKTAILATINLLRAVLIVFAIYYFPVLFMWQK